MRMERLNAGDALSPEEVLAGDPRSRSPNLSSVLDLIGEMAIGQTVPVDVREQIGVAKAAFVAGHMFYELYSVSILHAAIACETALKERFRASLSFPVTLRNIRRDQKTTPPVIVQKREELTTDWLFNALWDKWRIVSLPDFDGSFHQMIKWAEQEKACSNVAPLEAMKDWRNVTAHGGHFELVDQSTAATMLAEVVQVLIELFP